MALSIPAFSQQILNGRIHKTASDEVLVSVSVINITQKKANISDIGGNYKIPARPGDTVTFSSAGYKPDTAFVSNWMFEEKDGFQIYLEPNSITLATVRVGELSNYQLDSMKRHEEYKWAYPTHRRRLIGSETPTDGVGVSISPFDYFGAKETNLRRLRKRIEEEEKEYYIDSRFPVGYVQRITGLKNDSLKTFLYRYRPSYDFCRKSSAEDMFLYINDQVKKYREGKLENSSHR
jgi:hypothetical protein